MWTNIGAGIDGGSKEGFLSAVMIWINKPHVVNRRLCGSCTLHRTSLKTHVKPEQCITSIKEKAETLAKQEEFEALLESIFPSDTPDTHESVEGVCHVEVWVRDIHPKMLEKFSTQREIVFLDHTRAVAIFIPLLLVSTSGSTSVCLQNSYRLDYNNQKISISVAKDDETRSINADRTARLEQESQEERTAADKFDSESTINDTECASSDLQSSVVLSGAGCTNDWLHDHLLRKVGQWSYHDRLNTDVTSLKLVPLDRYNCRYNEMKNKYGPHLVKNWPESTDPQKFVYEDIAIAAYLLTLWEEERIERGLSDLQSFVDLGCGNGLLVHLLSEEGHPGKGIDLRRRNIWDGFYGPKTQLEEFALTPSDKNLFEGYDWLIGNHSDELTPWIPVIAARSSYTCRYFILPCCSYDFDSKFRVKEHGKSQYRCYLDYVRLVGETCGFEVEEDTLRIPSTKRVCFVGKSRTYPNSEEANIDAVRTDFISSRCSIHQSNAPLTEHGHMESTKDDAWADNFKARSSEEKPRNCVSLDKALTACVVAKVFDAVLHADGAKTVVTSDGRIWNTGGRLPLAEVVSLFEPSVLKELKNECGGLQTLLRNHYHIFRVQAGAVQIRDMGPEDEEHWNRKKKLKGSRKSDQDVLKTRLCYLHEKHPNGCPKSAEQCRFAHGQEELKVRSTEDVKR